MKQIDILKTGRLTDIIGPVGTLKRILRNHQYFLDNGLDISVYNVGKFFKDWEDKQPTSEAKKSKKQKIRAKLDNWAKHSFFLSVILVERKYHDHKKFVKRYLSHGRTPEVLVCHAEIECYYFLKLNKNKDIKTVLFFHNDGIPMKMYALYYPKLIDTWYMRLLLRRYDYTINHVDKCAFICEAGMRNINERYESSRDKSFLIVNGIDDLTPFELEIVKQIKATRKDNTINICCVGSVTVRKAQRFVIEALSILPSNLRNRYHLTIVGDGMDMEFCQELVSKTSLSSNVTFVGSVPNSDVYKYLALSDVFVLLSQNEGLPISIIEAMRVGLAIISTNISGIPELVAYNNGILLEPTAKALADILRTPDAINWRTMGENSRKTFEEKFTFERMKRDYVKMINTL